MNDKYKYQERFSDDYPILFDLDHKSPKVKKVLSILRDAEVLVKGGVVVDIGCSVGFFVKGVSRYFDRAIGVDIDLSAMLKGNEGGVPENTDFIVGDSMNLPFGDCSIDLILCNHVYEHVPSAEVLFNEIERVLKHGGVCYFGAASRFTLIEPHYKLPLLSWLPKPLANAYMRVFGKGEYYYENLRSRGGIGRLISRFAVSDYTLRVITEPDKFCSRDMVKKGGVIELIPLYFLKWIYSLLPSYIFVLTKK